ncbi:MAG: hypothetical protein LBP87_09650 [Planctomycetaceae bacterium]|jgi:hypothetical protein|nr:hypothetical protein [Planctomycetaceae bacterium]
MTENQSLFSSTWNDASEEDVMYTRLSIPALLALIFGLTSFLVFMTPWFFFLSILGIFLSFVAIISIGKAEGGLTGLRFAQLGLCSSIISLTAVAILWPSYQYGVRLEADRFFRIWFDALQHDNIPLAKGLTSPYWERPASDKPEEWWKKQYENNFLHKSIHSYTDNKLIRVLLALGDKAKVSYYKTLSVTTSDEKDTVVTLYAVSFPNDNGETETFFVKMIGKRSFPSGDIKSAGWALEGIPTVVVPDELKSIAQTPKNKTGETKIETDHNHHHHDHDHNHDHDHDHDHHHHH